MSNFDRDLANLLADVVTKLDMFHASINAAAGYERHTTKIVEIRNEATKLYLELMSKVNNTPQ